MPTLKVNNDSRIKILGDSKFIVSGSGVVSPVNTTIYDSSGNILDTVFGDVPAIWKFNQGIAGYVEIGTSATTIGQQAFAINQLTSVTLGNSLTAIGEGAFNSNLLTSITIPESVTNIGLMAFWQNLFTTVTIPSSVTAIGSLAFANNPGLHTVNCYTTQSAFVANDAFANTHFPLTIHVRSTDSTWTAQTGWSFQGNVGVTIIKDL